MYYTTEEIPKLTGEFMYLECRLGYSYCLLPSYWANHGMLLHFSEQPSFFNQYQHSKEIGKVSVIILLVNYQPIKFQFDSACIVEYGDVPHGLNFFKSL